MNTDKYKGQSAISYARASLGKGKGQESSTDRQSNITLDYCEKMGLNLDLNYRIIDEGVSAYKQVKVTDEYGRVKTQAKNLSESALADFVTIVKQGRFPKGVHLVIEKLDRMYRDVPTQALEHFTSLLNNGVIIHTPLDNKVYDSSNDDPMMLFGAVMQLVASHQYSQLLSSRIKESVLMRISEMENTDRLYKVSKIADWFKISYEDFSASRNKKIKNIYIPEYNRNIIEQIYLLYLDNFSTQDIVRKLNNEGSRNFVNELWDKHMISAVLKNKSVMGFIVPKKGTKISRPEWKIISKKDFYQVQEIMSGKTSKGKLSPDGNIFSGVITCGYCECKTKNKKHRPYEPSTLIYRPLTDTNRVHTPKDINPRRFRSYVCKSGNVSSKNCNTNKIDYYKIQDSFFSFVKDLDFSSLVDTNTKLQNKELQNKLLEIKAEVKELEIKIADQKKLLPLIKNETALEEIAGEIDLLSNDKDEKLLMLENQKLILEEHQNQKQDFVNSEKSIKDLITKCNNDNVYYALATKVKFYNPVGGNGHRVPLAFKLSDSQKEEKADIDRLWILPRYIIDAVKSEDKELSTKLESEEMQLKKKYFAKEVKLDEEALVTKKRLNGELRKFIKKIKVYPYGFTTGEPSRPFDVRKGKPLVDLHKEGLSTFLGGLNDESTEEPKPKYKKGWTIEEISGFLKMERRSYNRLIAKGKIENYKGTNKSLISLRKKVLESGARGQTMMQDKSYSRFLGYSIEFTDLCKPNEIRYVLPYYKDAKKGISFNLNTRTTKWNFVGGFGEKKIALTRNEFVHSSHKQEDLIIIQDDPIFNKGFELTTNIFRKAEQESAKNSFNFNKEDFKKLKTKEEKKSYFLKGLEKMKTLDSNYQNLNQILKLFPESDKEISDEGFNKIEKIIDRWFKD
jgi:hypothetical protein